MCDVADIVAVTNPEAKRVAYGLSLFLVEAGVPGSRKVGNWTRSV